MLFNSQYYLYKNLEEDCVKATCGGHSLINARISNNAEYYTTVTVWWSVSGAYPRVVDPGEDVVADGAEEDDSLRGAASAARHQFHAHHLPIAHHDVAEHLHHTHTHIIHLVYVRIPEFIRCDFLNAI